MDTLHSAAGVLTLVDDGVFVAGDDVHGDSEESVSCPDSAEVVEEEVPVAAAEHEQAPHIDNTESGAWY